jgi:glutamyl-tRNA reductase
VTLANIDDLRAVVERHRHVRRAEARRAEGIVEEEIHVFAGWLGSLEVMPTIAALREHGDDIVRGVLAENEQKWESLSDRDRARVEAVARAVANRLLHEPTLKVKDAGSGHRHARMHLLRELFGLSEEPVLADDGEAAEVRQLRPRGS